MTAAVAMATQPQPAQRHADITITPMEPPARYAAEEIDAEQHLPPENDAPHNEAPFIPPAPEAPPQRMPRVEDFPVVAQRQLEAHRDPLPSDEDRGPLSLLRRLANVGLGRRDDDPIGAGPQRPAQPAQRSAQQRSARPSGPAQPQAEFAKRTASPRSAPANEGLYRPRQGDLDAHGRPLPQATRTGDDELEIPAFLRRQAN
jgi:cell division protein FtsZ